MDFELQGPYVTIKEVGPLSAATPAPNDGYMPSYTNPCLKLRGCCDYWADYASIYGEHS